VDEETRPPGAGPTPPRAALYGCRFTATHPGQPLTMRFGNVEIRPLGGGLGCLLMILFSVLASVILTVLANLLLN
jgi:hypothetical protein